MTDLTNFRFSTHRAIQLSVLADTARAEASVLTRAAANAASIENRSAARHFINRANRFNMIAIKAAQRAVL